MKTWQRGFGVLVAAGVAYSLLARGYPPRYALLGVPAYIGVTWVLATVGRTRYYLGRPGYRQRSCPSCGGYVRRLRNDWILTCHRCGWRAGWPAVRWLTQSVPVRQFKRTISWPGLAVSIGVVALVVVGPGVVAGMAEDLPSASNISVGPDENQSQLEEGYNVTEVRTEFRHLLNAERSRRGLGNLSQRETLVAMGQAHAENMAEHDYIGHTEPDGSTIRDRYEARGLLPECRLPIQGSDRYYPGAENAYTGHVDTRIRRSDGSIISVYDEADLARAIFASWMHSDPHRRAMLVASADEMGLGVSITEDDEVYVALELC